MPRPRLYTDEERKERVNARTLAAYAKHRVDPQWREQQKMQHATMEWKERRAVIARRWREKQKLKRQAQPDFDAHLRAEGRRYARQEQVRDPALYKIRHKVYRQRYGAKLRGLEHTLTIEDLAPLLVKPCHYCGKETPHNQWQSIDRANNDEGYVQGNVVPACWRCNSLKHTTPYEEFVERIGGITHAKKPQVA